MDGDERCVLSNSASMVRRQRCRLTTAVRMALLTLLLLLDSSIGVRLVKGTSRIEL